MPIQRLLAVLFLAAAIVAAVLFFPNDPDGAETGGAGDTSRSGPGATDAQALDGTALAGTSRDAAGLESSARAGGPAVEALVGEAAAALAETEADVPAGELRSIEVTAAWPDATRPAGAPLVVAFDAMVSGQAALSALQQALPEGVERRQPVSELLFGDAGDDGSIPDATWVLGSAPLERGPNDEWVAKLRVPVERGRVFLHAVGYGYWTPETVHVAAGQGVARLPLARGGRVAVQVARSAGVDSAALESTLVRVEEPSDFLRAAERSRRREGSFAVDLAVDASGVAPALTVPAGVELIARGEHPVAIANEPAPFDVAAGQTFDVGLRLLSGAQLSGRVLLPDGAPAPAGLNVQAMQPGKAFGLDDLVLRTTETGAEGRFSLTGLEGTRFRVRVEADGYLDARSDVLKLDRGVPSIQDLELQLGTGRSIRGRVVDTAGAGIEGLEVEAQVDVARLMGVGAMTAMSGPRGAARTDADGAFDVAGLGAGPFTVRALGDERVVLARADSVGPGIDDLILVAMEPKVLTGRVVDDTQRAVPAVEIRLARVSNAQIGEVRMERRAQRSGDDGAFAFSGVTEGTYELWVRTETHATLESMRVEVSANEEPEPMTLVAPRAASASGIVFDANGDPKAGALVTYYDPGRSRYTPSRVAGPVVQPTRTNGDGSFEIVGLPAFELQLEASHPEHPAARSEAVTLSPGGERTGVTIQLKSGGTIKGICFDADSNPAGDRLISANHSRLQEVVTGRSADDGTFELVGLAAGPWSVVAMDPTLSLSNDEGQADMSAMFSDMRMKSVDVADGETTFVLLGSPAAESVEVTGLVRVGGRPSEGRVLAWFGGASEDAETFKGASTNADGRYTVELPGPGGYLVQCSSVGATLDRGQSTEFFVEVPEGSTRFEYDVDLPGGRLSGRILGPDGEPLAGERVTLVPDGGIPVGGLIARGYGEIRSGSGGAFAFENVGPGRYFVSAGGGSLLGDRRDASGRVTVGPFELDRDTVRNDIEVRLVRAGALAVRVVDGSGSPLNGASIFLERADGRVTEYITLFATNARGERTIHGIAPGEYIVSARTESGTAPDSPTLTVRTGETQDIELSVAPGTLLDVRTVFPDEVQPGTVSLRVLDAEGRDHGRRVSAIDINRRYKKGIQADRRTVGPLPPGRYTVLATAPGGFDGKKRVLIEAGDERDGVTVRLR